MKPETKLRKLLQKLETVLHEDFGFSLEMPEQDCDCTEHVCKTVSPENVPAFLLIMNLMSLLAPRELGEVSITFENACSSIIINPYDAEEAEELGAIEEMRKRLQDQEQDSHEFQLGLGEPPKDNNDDPINP